MNTLTIARYNMRQRALSTGLTMFLVAVGVALVSAIWIINREVQHGFGRGVAGRFHLVVGPKGSPLQLVLNAVFHMDKPVGNLSYAVFESLQKDRRVKLAIPMALGDNFQGFHIVGTTSEFISRFEYQQGRTFGIRGRAFKDDFEAVLGSEVARRTGLKIGDKFMAAHGVVETPVTERHEHAYTVVGILEPTRTPHDRALYCTLASVMDLHDLQDVKLAAVLVLAEHHRFIGDLAKEINDGPDAMAVYPNNEIGNLMKIVGSVDTVLIAVSYLVLLAAGISIFVSIYNSMAERRREIAIIRALGAPAGVVFRMIVIEASSICFVGAVAGLLLSHGFVFFGRAALQEWTGVPIGPGLPTIWDAALLAGTVLLGAVSSLVPAVAAYRTDVATNIRPTA